MGREARVNAQERLQAGVIPVRIGKRSRAKDRKLAEKRRQIFLPVAKKGAPLVAGEINGTFEAARKVQAEVRAGVRPPGKVDLSEEHLIPIPEVAAQMLADAVVLVTTTARLRLRHHAPEEGEATT